MQATIYPGPYLYDPAAQLVQGARLSVNRILTAARWRAFRAGNLDGLFEQTGNEINGLTLLANHKSSIPRLQYFAAVTRALVDALFSERPETSPTFGGDWLQQMETAIDDAVTTGLGVLVRSGETLYAAPAEYSYAVLDGPGGDITGWALCHPYRNYADLSDDSPFHNRVQVGYFPTGGRSGWVREFEYGTGYILGRMLAETEVVGADVAYLGSGRSEYRDIEAPARELMVRTALQSRVLNRHSSPHMTGPASGRPRAGFRYDPAGMYLPVDDDGGPGYDYLTWDPAGTAVDEHMRRLREDLFVFAATPAAALGINTGSPGLAGGRSGLAEDRALFPFIAKVRRYRAWLEAACETLLATEITWGWPDDPLLGWSDRTRTEIALVEAGIETPQAAGARLGLT